MLLELARRGAEVTYVRTAAGREVDFVARYYDGRAELIQVCAELAAENTYERELRALLEAAKEHRRAELHVIMLDPALRRKVPAAVALHDAAEWLLSGGPVER